MTTTNARAGVFADDLGQLFPLSKLEIEGERVTIYIPREEREDWPRVVGSIQHLMDKWSVAGYYSVHAHDEKDRKIYMFFMRTANPLGARGSEESWQ
jgi:hypothetical protein